jgi:hypothetical protein
MHTQNLNQSIADRLIKSRGDNASFPVKTYATETAATRAADKFAPTVAGAFAGDVSQTRYFTLFIEAWKRYIVVFDVTYTITSTGHGGYVAVAAAHGFYSI